MILFAKCILQRIDMKMQVNGLYKWKHEVQQLIYLGRQGSWHQFALAEAPEHIWCEVLTQDLHMLEAI